MPNSSIGITFVKDQKGFMNLLKKNSNVFIPYCPMFLRGTQLFWLLLYAENLPSNTFQIFPLLILIPVICLDKCCISWQSSVALLLEKIQIVSHSSRNMEG
ncbi:hypothetical protein BpHYR1_022881 [Brachionus plicatilis]|uniref:Uncharacterized protein n=1 Tax=Brachionus plicatilis TaxID=10195 RepID=A0A3M7PJH9_BRAPC|nr:hypothetical protein BpHYR1_022881 [Brachionus plicatilis]